MAAQDVCGCTSVQGCRLTSAMKYMLNSCLSCLNTHSHGIRPKKVKLVYTTSNCSNLLAKVSNGKLSCMRAQRML